MKKLRVIAVLTVICCMMGMLAACQVPEETEPSYTGEVYTFEAIVYEVSPGKIHVRPVSGETEMAAAADKGLIINDTLWNGDKVTGLEKGMQIRVSYNGVITYSLPARISGVISVEILKQAS